MRILSHFSPLSLLVVLAGLLVPACTAPVEEPIKEDDKPIDKPVTPSVSTTPSGTIEIPAEGGTVEIKIQVNTSYYRYTVSKVEWISTVIDKSKDYNCMVVTVQPNTTTEERSMKLSFWASKDGDSKDAETSVLVHQAAGAEPHPNAVSVQAAVDLGGGDPTGYELHTLAGDYTLSGSEAAVQTLSDGNTPQLNMITDKNGEVVLLSRDIYANGASLALSPRTTATALVTMHPAFAAIRGAEHYQRLVSMAQGTTAFAKLEQAVEAAVKAGKPVLDAGNTALMNAYDEALDALYEAIVPSTRFSEVFGLDGNEEPFRVDVEGKQVSIYYKGLSPMYEGAIYYEDGRKLDNLDIPAGGDLGVTDIFYPDQLYWRDRVMYDFSGITQTHPETFKFSFDRGTKKAVINLAVNLVCSGLDVVGATVSTFDAKNLTAAATQFFLSRDISLIQLMMSGSYTKTEILEALYGAIADFVASPFFTNLCTAASAATVQFYVKKLSPVVTVYCALRGSTNLNLRALFCLSTPLKVTFSLKNQGSLPLFVGGYAKPELVFGNNQEGHSQEALPTPIVIKVNTGENKNPAPGFIVRFTVVEGGGWVEDVEKYTNDRMEALTRWYLGQDSVNQVLEVDVIDPISGGTINDLPLEVCAKATDLGEITLEPVPEQFRGKWQRFDQGEGEGAILLTLNAQSASYENPDHPEYNFNGVQIGSVMRPQMKEVFYDLYFNVPDVSGKEPYEPFLKSIRLMDGYDNVLIVGKGYVGGESEVYNKVVEKDLPDWCDGCWWSANECLYVDMGNDVDGKGYALIRLFDTSIWNYIYYAENERVFFFHTGYVGDREKGDIRRVSDGATLISDCYLDADGNLYAGDVCGLGSYTLYMGLADF